ncbi:class I SAM-dependent methyltransferase [Amycolatopsis nigrescens]|uniref:class I SAM-dependent methyltransferase n=1 Tax=Amycolatopsis nigrescens TaxID=381445 RepID=UPI0003648061|nr:class I SAM-dependent methyltransferase [Amycolatopsis nigrescens]
MSPTNRHPLFARMYPRIAAWAETHGAAEHRAELLAGVTGRVIEVGAGHGVNFPHYPHTVTEVVAVEPEPALRAQAEKAARISTVPITVVDGVAEELPAEDASFDVVVTSLVLCSISDPTAALGEARRVLRPEGELRFYEHIRAHEQGFARYQRAVDLLWPYLAGGCHVSKPTDRTIAEAGFTIDQIRHFRFPSAKAPSSPCVIGHASPQTPGSQPDPRNP